MTDEVQPHQWRFSFKSCYLSSSFAASVEKTQRERGASIMGNEVYSY